MFFKQFRLKDSNLKDKNRLVVVAAMRGERPEDDKVLEEKEGFRELFTTSVDYTDMPDFDINKYRVEVKLHLEGTLKDYNLIPADDKMEFLESGFRKALGRAYMSNKVKKQYLHHHLEKMEGEESDRAVAILKDAHAQKAKQLLMN